MERRERPVLDRSLRGSGRGVHRHGRRFGWEEIHIEPVSGPAWMGSDVADVMSYVRGMPMICGLAADLGDEALTGRVLATVAGQYAARQRPDGVWVHAAAWLVTAQRGTEHILLGLHP